MSQILPLPTNSKKANTPSFYASITKPASTFASEFTRNNSEISSREKDIVMDTQAEDSEISTRTNPYMAHQATQAGKNRGRKRGGRIQGNPYGDRK